MATFLTDDAVKELRFAFNLFDNKGTGKIRVQELETVLNALGRYPSDLELQVMMKEIVTEEKQESFDFVEFVSFISRHIHSEVPEIGDETATNETSYQEHLFSIFAEKGNGYGDTGIITKDCLKRILNQVGERLTDCEIDEMFAELSEGKEFISLEQFQNQLFGPNMNELQQQIHNNPIEQHHNNNNEQESDDESAYFLLT